MNQCSYEDPQILGVAVRNFAARATWCVGFVHPSLRYLFSIRMVAEFLLRNCAVPQLGLGAGLSLRRSGCFLRTVHVAFFVDRVAPGKGFLPSASLYACRRPSTSAPYSFAYHRCCIIVGIDSDVT
jgi:hypothetical protein